MSGCKQCADNYRSTIGVSTAMLESTCSWYYQLILTVIKQESTTKIAGQQSGYTKNLVAVCSEESVEPHLAAVSTWQYAKWASVEAGFCRKDHCRL